MQSRAKEPLQTAKREKLPHRVCGVAAFYTIGNFVTYRIKKHEYAHSRARNVLPGAAALSAKRTQADSFYLHEAPCDYFFHTSRRLAAGMV